MGPTVADTIRRLTKEHLDSGRGINLGQCLTAVGWVQNTIPEQVDGNFELPMTDVAGAGFAVGIALMGKRPILIIRFQSLLWLNASPIVNHAAKAKELFGVPCPVFVRAIASEGGGQGPVHTNCYHSIFMHMPGIPVVSPMTPKEYEGIWKHYLAHDDPMLVSEHRRSYRSADEIPDIINEEAEITLFAISASRFTAVEAIKLLKSEGIKANLVNLLWLKPFLLIDRILAPLMSSSCGIVIDSGYEICGASQSIAYDLMITSGKPVQAMGQFDRSPGVATYLENGTPKVERIVKAAKKMISNPWRHPIKQSHNDVTKM